MKLAKLLTSTVPLLIAPSVLRAHLNLAERNPHGLNLAELRTKAPATPRAADSFMEYFFGATEKPSVVGATAVIPVSGPIGTGLSQFEKDLGCCDLNDVMQWFLEAQDNPKVSSILLDISSPGGSSIGVPEFAAMVAASKKPVCAFTDDQCCSAAYWIASQATAVYSTSSAYVGSIGVYIAMEDYSVMYANAGVKVEVIKSGDLKGAGIDGTSLTDAQREQLQGLVVALHQQFMQSVTSKRTSVKEDSMRGQSFTGSEAAERGLVTGLVASRSAALAKMNA